MSGAWPQMSMPGQSERSMISFDGALRERRYRRSSSMALFFFVCFVCSVVYFCVSWLARAVLKVGLGRICWVTLSASGW